MQHYLMPGEKAIIVLNIEFEQIFRLHYLGPGARPGDIKWKHAFMELFKKAHLKFNMDFSTKAQTFVLDKRSLGHLYLRNCPKS